MSKTAIKPRMGMSNAEIAAIALDSARKFREAAERSRHARIISDAINDRIIMQQTLSMQGHGFQAGRAQAPAPGGGEAMEGMPDA